MLGSLVEETAANRTVIDPPMVVGGFGCDGAVAVRDTVACWPGLRVPRLQMMKLLPEQEP